MFIGLAVLRGGIKIDYIELKFNLEYKINII